MANEGEPEFNKNIEQFLMELEVKWKLGEDIPRILAEGGMPLRGRAFSMIPDDNGERLLRLFTFPGDSGCEFCGLEEPGLIHNHHLIPQKWHELGSPFSTERLRLCPNCYSSLYNAMKERFHRMPKEDELTIFLFEFSYQKTAKAEMNWRGE